MGGRVTVLAALAIVGCGRLDFGVDVDAAAAGDAARDASPAGDAAGDAGAQPIRFVQCVGASNGGGNDAPATFATDVAAGDGIILAVDYQTLAVVAKTITDTLGTTYAVVAGPNDDSMVRHYLAYGRAPTAGPDTVTFALTGSSGADYELRACEFAGLATTNAFDTTVTANGNAIGTDAAVSPTFTTASPNELVFSFEEGFCNGAAGTGYSEATGYAADESEYAIAPTAGMYQSLTTTIGAGTWSVTVATFRGQ